MEAAGDLTSTQAKAVLAELVADGGEPAAVAAALGFEAVDTGELESLVDRLITDNPDEWARFCDGDRKVQGFFVGQVMKATLGQADGKIVNQLLTQKSTRP
jgi:aspartyl-tRNA(Asn)/glutamyl-tRNA(Gln) amidotransferase subunit B